MIGPEDASAEPESHALRLEMQRVRTAIDSDVRQMSERARQLTDWKHYVAAAPLLSAGLAAAAGFLIVPSGARGKNAGRAVTGSNCAADESSDTTAATAGVFAGLTAFALRTAVSMLVKTAVDSIAARSPDRTGQDRSTRPEAGSHLRSGAPHDDPSNHPAG